MFKRDVNVKKLSMGSGLLVAVILLIALYNSSGPKHKMAEMFDEEEVMSMAKEAVEYFNERDYQSMIDMMTEEYAGENTEESLAEQYDSVLDECGAFVEFSDVEPIGGTNPETGEEYGGALVDAEYEDGVLSFSIGFTQDMKMRQFLIQE